MTPCCIPRLLLRSIRPYSSNPSSPHLHFPTSTTAFNSQFTTCAVVSTPSCRKLGIPPCLMIFDGGLNIVYKLYNLARNEISSITHETPELLIEDFKFVGSSHGWLSCFNQSNTHDDMYLLNPLSGRHINLPPFHNLPYPGINSVSKLILSCSPEEEECRAMMTVGPGDRLAFCVPGRSKEWTPIGFEFFAKYLDNLGDDMDGFTHRRRIYEDYKKKHWRYRKCYKDFVYCSGGKFFSCTTQFKLDLRSCRPYSPTEFEDWDLRDPSSPRVRASDRIGLFRFDRESCSWLRENKNRIRRCVQIPYLVEHSDQLFVVIQFVTRHKKTLGFSVFKVEYDKGHISNLRLVEGDRSLDGMAMFVGINSHSFAVSSADFPEFEPNSIYFIHPSAANDSPPSISYDIGIFDYKNKTFFYPYSRLQSLTRPMWFTPTQH